MSVNLGEKLKDLRISKGLTQKQLAMSIGVEAAAVANYESGLRVPRDETKKKIAKVFGKSVEAIFFE